MSTISTSTGGLTTFSGLASGVNTSQIIKGITQVNQQQITNLTNQQSTLQTEQSTFSNLATLLTTLQGSVTQLTSSATLGGQTATTSDSSVLTAAADSTAQSGTYNLTVNNLATAEQLASSGVSSISSPIQQGTLQVQVGSGSATTITIDNTNNTLQGLADAINSSGGDVQASIVNDGSSTPYRLLLTSSQTGSANTIQITNNLTSGTGASLDFDQVVQPPSDASVSLGSGSGALTFTSPTNTINDAISGVTLNVLQAAPNTTQTLTIAGNTSSSATAIQNFVTSYNAVVDNIAQNSQEASTSGSTTTPAGDLLGNTDSEQILNTLQNTVSTIVGGVNSNASSLAAIGITFNSSGDLQINQTTLNQALSGQISGVGSSDIQSLFGLNGQSSSPGVSFVLGTATTQPSGSTPYQVNITRAATQASITAGTALASTVNIDSTNNQFTIDVNGVTSSPINIPTGSYTPSQLAATLQSAINSNPLLGKNQVSVGLNGSGEIQITSNGYGSLSQLGFAGGSALGASGPLGFAGTEANSGQDVAGYFNVNGVQEAATGYGQILSGNAGNANTNGLQVNVTLDASQVGTGFQSNLTVTEGVATQLNQVLTNLLAPVNGELATINTKLQASITSIGNQITTQNTALQSETTDLNNEFAQMEVTISQLQTQGQELTALLNAGSSGSISYGPKSLSSGTSSSSSGG